MEMVKEKGGGEKGKQIEWKGGPSYTYISNSREKKIDAVILCG